MAQLGVPLRGHQLAKDGLPVALPSLVHSCVLNHPLSSDGDDLLIYPAGADSIPDPGGGSLFYLPFASTSQRFAVSALFNDQTNSGSTTLILRKNGINVGSIFTITGNFSSLNTTPWNNSVSFAAGDRWDILASQQHLGAGLGSQYIISVNFFA